MILNEKNDDTYYYDWTIIKKKTGGIAFAMQGYLDCLDNCELSYNYVATRDQNTKIGRWIPLLIALFSIPIEIKKRKDKNVIVYAHAGEWFSILREFMVLLVSKLFKAKTIIHFHAPELEIYLESYIGRLFFKIVITPVDAIFVLTPWWKNKIRKHANKKRIFLVPNPLSSKQIDVLRNYNTNYKNKSVLCLTRIEPGKGVRKLVYASKYLPNDIKIYIAGSGSIDTDVKKMIIDSGVSNKVTLLGWVTGEEKRKLYETSRVFCFLSKRDSFGMALVEAICHGLPIVAFDTPNLRYLAPKTEPIYEKACSKQIANKIIDVINNMDRELNIAKANKINIMNILSFKKVSKDIDNYFETILGKL